MKAQLRTFLLMPILGFLFIGAQANAAIIHSNFGPDDSFGSGYWRASTYRNLQTPLQGDDLASPFTPVGNDFYLDQIEIAVRLEDGPNILDVWIMSDDSGSPGSILEAFDFSGDVPYSAAIISKNSVSRPILSANTQYWIALSTASGAPTNTSVDWYLTSPLITGTMYFRDSEGGSWTYLGPHVSAFRISGSAVPIPGAVWLLGSGIIGLVALRRKVRN